jgi:hypothetical protein
VTSGPLSASLTGRNCGLGYVATADASIGTELEVDIRGKRAKAKVVAVPFCARRVKDEPKMNTWSPYELRFSEQHAWTRLNENEDDGSQGVVSVGLSDFGQRALWRHPGPASYRRSARRFSRCADGVGRQLPQGVRHHCPDLRRSRRRGPGRDSRPVRLNAVSVRSQRLLKVRLDQPRAYEALMSFTDYEEHVRRVSLYDEWTRKRRLGGHWRMT